MLSHIAKGIYRAIDWEIDKNKALGLWESKNVLIGFPHTSILDTVVTIVGIFMLGKKSYTFIKKEAFVWPLSWLLKLNRAIPVDRNQPKGIVGQIVDEFNQRKEFSICIVPQGTRKADAKLRTGFWHIAKQANASILCWYFDTNNKKVVCLGKFHPGADINQDLDAMQKLYDTVGYNLPRK